VSAAAGYGLGEEPGDEYESGTMPAAVEAAMTDAEKISRFVLAGNATFTLESRRTGARFTFRARCKRDGTPAFVSVLTGSNNESDYEYLGCVFFDTRSYFHGTKSRIRRDAPSAKAFKWFWDRLSRGEVPEECAFFHAGRCGRCGRKLTVPESVESGLGPECSSRA
jgi:hypothetical protein